MDKYFIVGVVILICIVLVIYTQLNDSEEKSTLTLKQQLQKAYPNFTVIEKSGTIMICEMNHRDELEELVLLRIDPKQKKNIRLFGRRATITYEKQPSLRQIKKDAALYLQ